MDVVGEELESGSLLIERPAICLFDIQADVSDLLIEKHYNVELATLGSPIGVANRSRGDVKHVSLNYDYPENLHEFDVVVLDLCGEKEVISYRPHSVGNATGGEAYAIHTSYPESVFDPRPGAMSIVGKEIDALLKKISLVIIFADSIESAHYRTVKISRKGTEWHDGFSGSTQDYMRLFQSLKEKWVGDCTQPNLNLYCFL